MTLPLQFCDILNSTLRPDSNLTLQGSGRRIRSGSLDFDVVIRGQIWACTMSSGRMALRWVSLPSIRRGLWRWKRKRLPFQLWSVQVVPQEFVVSIVTPLSSKTDSGFHAGVSELTSIALDVPVGQSRALAEGTK